VEERNDMVVANRELVYSYVHEFFRARQGLEFVYDMEDACADGFLGLIRACELFDPDKGFALSTYVHYWVFNYLMVGMRNQYLVRRSGVCRKTYKRWTLNEDIDQRTHEEDPTDLLAQGDARELLEDAMRFLNVREKRVIQLKLQGKTLEECGVEIGVTKERARQLHIRARQRLRKILANNRPKLTAQSL